MSSADEYEIKAAMLLNLALFVEWSPSKLGPRNSPFVIGIVGRDPFGQDLEKVIGNKTVAGHPVVVERLGNGGKADACHILFIARSERKRMSEISNSLTQKPVLTIGDGDRFAASGSIFGLVIRDNRVQLEVNIGAAQRNGFAISSRLLRIATVVRDGS